MRKVINSSIYGLWNNIELRVFHLLFDLPIFLRSQECFALECVVSRE